MMGGALGLALKQRGLALRVVGVDTSEETLQTAQKMGAIDAGTADIAAVRDADCVIFAAPVPTRSRAHGAGRAARPGKRAGH